MQTTPSIIALDVGERRVGIAVASLAARLARPLTTLERGEQFLAALTKLIDDEHVGHIVIGYPRGMQGQVTEQTGVIESFAEDIRQHVNVPISYQDEALTSRQAEEELKARGRPYKKGDIDALAATYILDDYLAEHPGGSDG
jgi:putative Holliday junction resolvase